MLEILTRSIARAGGIEVPNHVRITGEAKTGSSLWQRTVDAFKRWEARRSSYLVLNALDDRALRDIGIDRNLLHKVADDLARLSVANDNEPVPLAALAANDNGTPPQTDCA